MAFHKKKEITSESLKEILDYTKYLKTTDDSSIKRFMTPEGYFLNITKIDQTEEEKKTSESMEKFYNNYRDIIKDE
jgi:hypothetical protein